MHLRSLTPLLAVLLAGGCDAAGSLEPALDASAAPALLVASGDGKATGHAVITVQDPIIGAKPEEYSFTAQVDKKLSATPSPVDAKGQMEFRTHRPEALGGTIRVHAEVIC